MTNRLFLNTTRGSQQTGVLAAGTTAYFWMGQAILNSSSSEANRQVTYRTPGTLKKMHVRVIANTTTTFSLVNLRKNTLNGNQLIAIPAGQTGEFTADVDLTDTITAGDKINYRVVVGETGSITISILSVLFEPTSNFPSRLVAEGYTISTDNSTNYLFLAGDRSGSTTDESRVENTIKVAGTAKNGFVYVNTNARTSSTTFVLRKNRLDTVISITVPAGGTGVYEYTSTGVSFAVDDEINWKILTGTGLAEALAFEGLAVDYETATHGLITTSTQGASSEVTQNFATTSYYAIGGGLKLETASEANHQMTARTFAILSHLTVRVRSNTLDGSSTLRIRKNGVNGSQSITIPAGSTAFLADTINTDSIADTDLINYQLTTTGTTGSITFAQVSVWVSASPLDPIITTPVTSVVPRKTNLKIRYIDEFGTQLIYAPLQGGSTYDSTSWNSNPRILEPSSGDIRDPLDPDVCVRDVGGPLVTIHGDGSATFDGTSTRLAVIKSWQNVETTVYVMTNNDYQCDVDIRPKTDHYCVDCAGNGVYNSHDCFGGYGVGYDWLNSRTNAGKEKSHAIGYSGKIDIKPLVSPPLYTWIGIKGICYTLPSGYVKVEMYVDMTDGLNGGTWIPMSQGIDDGTWRGTPDPGTHQGSAIRTNSNDEAGWPDASYKFKKWSIREIVPPTS